MNVPDTSTSDGAGDGRLAGETAVVTGAASGIGQAIAVRFGELGARVVVLDHDDDGATETCRTIGQTGGDALAVVADLRRVSEIERAFADAARRAGPVTILVNCAGIFRTLSLEETDEEAWDVQCDVNLKAAFFCCRAVVPAMKKAGRGKIVNISSIAGLQAFPNAAAYCASKGGVVNLTKALAFELAASGINVNGIAPGNVESPMNAHLRAGAFGVEWTNKMAERTPSGVGFYVPSDLLGTAVFLVSPDADALHGATIPVDGGIHTG